MIHGSPTPSMARGMLLFALIVGAFAVYLVATQAWLEGSFFLALATFFGCFGRMMQDNETRWDKLFLFVGLIAGVTAFGLAVMMVGWPL